MQYYTADNHWALSSQRDHLLFVLANLLIQNSDRTIHPWYVLID
jgi:hypothetical protein